MWISGYITIRHLSPTESPFIYGTRGKNKDNYFQISFYCQLNLTELTSFWILKKPPKPHLQVYTDTKVSVHNLLCRLRKKGSVQSQNPQISLICHFAGEPFTPSLCLTLNPTIKSLRKNLSFLAAHRKETSKIFTGWCVEERHRLVIKFFKKRYSQVEVVLETEHPIFSVKTFHMYQKCQTKRDPV